MFLIRSFVVSLCLVLAGAPTLVAAQGASVRAAKADSDDALIKRVAAAAYPPPVRTRHMDSIVEDALLEIRDSYAFAKDVPPFAKDWIEEHLADFEARMHTFARTRLAPRMSQIVERTLSGKLNILQLRVLDATAGSPDGAEDVWAMTHEIYEYAPEFIKTQDAVIAIFVATERKKSTRLRQNLQDVIAGRVSSPWSN